MSVFNRDELLVALRKLDAYNLLIALNKARSFGRFFITMPSENMETEIEAARVCSEMTNSLYLNLDLTKMREIVENIV